MTIKSATPTNGCPFVSFRLAIPHSHTSHQGYSLHQHTVHILCTYLGNCLSWKYNTMSLERQFPFPLEDSSISIGKTVSIWLVHVTCLTCRRYLATQAFSRVVGKYVRTYRQCTCMPTKLHTMCTKRLHTYIYVHTNSHHNLTKCTNTWWYLYWSYIQ